MKKRRYSEVQVFQILQEVEAGCPVVDGAHNADSARRLTEALEQYFDFGRVILILGVSSDKDISGIITELASLTREVIVTGSRHPRAVESAVLISEFSKWGIMSEVAENVASAVELALTKAKSGDLICATGSIFIVAEVMEEMLA